MAEEISLKGIIVSTAPNGEYGRRIRMITDRLGLITAFANGAAKENSKIIGAVRPMTCAAFSIARGRGAWNLHSVDVIDSFEELAMDYERMIYAMYVLETGEYFSADGMPEDEAKALLNLMFVTLKALRDGKLSPELVRSIYELRLMVLQGEYTLKPEDGDETAAAVWTGCIRSTLTALYNEAAYENADCTGFMRSVDRLFSRQAGHKFKTLGLLHAGL